VRPLLPFIAGASRMPLGLELTTALTALSVGALAFGLLGELIREHPVPRIDVWAFDIADRLQMQMLVDLAKVVTELGSFPVTAALAFATAVWAIVLRRPIDAAALVAGVLLSQVAVHVSKAAFDRPRPSGSLVETSLSAYPSGHALQSVTLVACAIVLVRGGVGWATRIAAVTVASVLVAVVAATRVYLHAHYLTDVLGGVALGVAVWAAVGVVALLAAASEAGPGRAGSRRQRARA
jgi:membrane-associated phospholipid phosphatase